MYGTVYFAIDKNRADLVDNITKVIGKEPLRSAMNGDVLLFKYGNCPSSLLKGGDSSELGKTLIRLYDEYDDIPFKCMAFQSNGITFGCETVGWTAIHGKGRYKYYFIQRHRCMITKEYIEENLYNSYLVRPFASYVEAYRYMQNGFWDDSCYGVYYRTDEGDWLLVSTVN